MDCESLAAAVAEKVDEGQIPTTKAVCVVKRDLLQFYNKLNKTEIYFEYQSTLKTKATIKIS